jgi:tetratricopeptide (TPR) repeat protein
VEATLALDPNNVEALFMQMEFQIQAPSIMGGDKANARRIADRIMRIDPVHGYFAQVRLARLDKRTDSIEGLYRKAVEIRPSDYEALLQLGYFLGTSKKFAESEARAREAIRVDPDRVEAHGLLAAALVQQKKWTELDRALPESERAVPDNLMPLYRAAADCVLTNVEIARAEQLLRRYLGQEPEPNMPGHADAHLWLGRALEKQGRKAEAVAEYHTALRMDPNSPAKQDLKRLK